MRKFIIAATMALLLVGSVVSTAFAHVPPGQRGYEGQPGNQGHHPGHHGNQNP